MRFNCLLGEGLFLEKPRDDIRHLWIVITPPIGIPPEVVIENLTTKRPKTADVTVVLQPGDHLYISHPSLIYYADARQVKVELLLQISEMKTVLETPFSTEVLSRIQEGIFASPFTKPAIKKFCAEALNSLSQSQMF